MSMTLNVPAPGTSSWLRRVWANLAWGIATVLRSPRRQVHPIWRRAHWLLVCGILSLAVGAVVATMFYVDGWVAEVVLLRPRWVRAVFEELTEFGRSGWFLWPMGLFLLALAFLASPVTTFVDRALLAMVGLRVGFLFLAIALPSLFVTIIKRVIGRARPLVGEHIDPFLFKQWVWRPDYASLPSGHATTAFAAATAIGALWPSLRLPMFIYACLIAASRVVLDAHYVSDVLAGAVAGIAGALLVRDRFATRRLVFSVSLDGKVDPMPGPKFTRIKFAHIKTVARRMLAS